MFRAIKEFFRPKLKCRRVGHHIEKIQIIARVRSKRSYVVCEDRYATLNKCVRCGHIEGIDLGGCKDSFQTVTMPIEMWDEIDSKGYVII